jgi:hypothetical protein
MQIPSSSAACADYPAGLRTNAKAAKISGWRFRFSLVLNSGLVVVTTGSHVPVFLLPCVSSPWYFVAFYSIVFLFERLDSSSIRSLKRAGHWLLCRCCYCSYTSANWLTEYRFMLGFVHTIRTVIVTVIVIDIVVDVVLFVNVLSICGLSD